MKRLMSLMVMAILVASLSACVGRAGFGTMAGAGLGSAAGGVISQSFENASPAVKTLSPIGGGLIGGAIGYWIDSMNAEKEEQQKLVAQRQQMAQQNMQHMLQNTRLSHPIAVQIGQQAFQVQTPQQFAGILAQLQPGVRIMVACNRKHQAEVWKDMAANGLVSCGSPQSSGDRVIQVFQRGNGALTPMTMDQAMRAL